MHRPNNVQPNFQSNLQGKVRSNDPAIIEYTYKKKKWASIFHPQSILHK